mmetsp:Transcript_12184/g.23586  ORF Transcript_12184/g.23586 Transcript_12184/m.23586 type:complete len:262 (+) Transcript_12184:454-1239(+)
MHTTPRALRDGASFTGMQSWTPTALVPSTSSSMLRPFLAGALCQRVQRPSREQFSQTPKPPRGRFRAPPRSSSHNSNNNRPRPLPPSRHSLIPPLPPLPPLRNRRQRQHERGPQRLLHAGPSPDRHTDLHRVLQGPHPQRRQRIHPLCHLTASRRRKRLERQGAISALRKAVRWSRRLRRKSHKRNLRSLEGEGGKARMERTRKKETQSCVRKQLMVEAQREWEKKRENSLSGFLAVCLSVCCLFAWSFVCPSLLFCPSIR